MENKSVLISLVIGALVCMGSGCPSSKRPVNHTPVAKAGADRTVFKNELVSLDASESSDSDGDPLSYQWTVESGPDQLTLSDFRAAKPTFTPASLGKFVLTLIVHDGKTESPPTRITITVIPSNTLPMASAGADQIVYLDKNILVNLDGSGSQDVDKDSLSYQWNQMNGPSLVKLSDDKTAKTNFTAEIPGDYAFSLTVNDGKAVSLPDEVKITVKKMIEFIPENPLDSMGKNTIYLSLNEEETGGDLLILEIKANEIANLFGLAFELNFNAEILGFENGDIGNLLGEKSETLFQAALEKDKDNKLLIGATRIGITAGINGSGTIASIRFHRKKNGSNRFGFVHNQVKNDQGDIIPEIIWNAGTLEILG